jgi:hypothetical protein
MNRARSGLSVNIVPGYRDVRPGKDGQVRGNRDPGSHGGFYPETHRAQSTTLRRLPPGADGHRHRR